MSKQMESNLFILSSFKQSRGFYQQLLRGIVSYEGLATRILKEIEAAHAFRQVERVRELARILINVPIREYQLTAQYYLVWCKCGELEYHNEVLERIIEQSQTCKTRALFSRGAFEGYEGNTEKALYFYAEALKTSPTVSEYIDLSRTIAVLKGTEGFHRSAIRDLEDLLPVIRYTEPRVYYDFLNSYAVELMQNHRLSEAHDDVVAAVSSPFGPFYREWQETWSEVRSKRKRRSTVTISRLEIGQEDEAEPEVPENALQTARVETVIDFMNANFHRRITLTELAKIVNLSVPHFCRLFSLHTGLPPGEYLVKLRMGKARQLLTTNFLSIKEIMTTVGYDVRSRANFIGQFKRYFDLTPSEYRKRFFRRR